MACFKYTLILIFISCSLSAQVIDSKKCDSTNRFPITKYLSLLKTKTLIPLDSALALNNQNKFVKAPNKPVVVYNYDPYYYWFRIVIKNEQQYPKDLMLLMAPIGMREGQLFQKVESKWRLIGRTG